VHGQCTAWPRTLHPCSPCLAVENPPVQGCVWLSRPPRISLNAPVCGWASLSGVGSPTTVHTIQGVPTFTVTKGSSGFQVSSVTIHSPSSNPTGRGTQERGRESPSGASEIGRASQWIRGYELPRRAHKLRRPKSPWFEDSTTETSHVSRRISSGGLAIAWNTILFQHPTQELVRRRKPSEDIP